MARDATARRDGRRIPLGRLAAGRTGKEYAAAWPGRTAACALPWRNGAALASSLRRTRKASCTTALKTKASHSHAGDVLANSGARDGTCTRMDNPLDSTSSASTNSATLAKITFIPQTALSRKPRPALPSVPDSRKKGKWQQSQRGPILPPGELPGGLSSGMLSSHCNTCGEDGRRGGKRELGK